MEFYRKAAWDDVYQRWILPENMREFKMIIYVFERRTFQDTVGFPDGNDKEKYKNDKVTKDYMDTLTINLTQKHRNLERLSKARYDKEIDELDKIDSNYIDYLINQDRQFLKDIFTKGAMRNLDEKFLKGIEYAIDNASPVAIKNYISEHKRTGIKLAYQEWENVWDDTLTDAYLMSIGNSLIAQLT